MVRENHKRSIVKAISWRFVASLTSIAIVGIATRDLMIALGVGVIEVISKIAIYYAHERAWNLIRWGVVDG